MERRVSIHYKVGDFSCPVKARLQNCAPAAQTDSFNILMVAFGLSLPISEMENNHAAACTSVAAAGRPDIRQVDAKLRK